MFSPLLIGSIGVAASGLTFWNYQKENEAKSYALGKATNDPNDANARTCLNVRQATEKQAFKTFVIVGGVSIAATLAALALRK
jgi:hypothetical protein